MSRKKLWPTPKAGQCGMTAKTSGRPIEKSTHLTTQVFVEAHGLSNDHNPPQSTFLQGDSPVSLSLSPGSAAARQTTATSGLRCAALLGYSSPGGSSLKTCLVSLLSKTDWSSTVCYLTWKAKATKSGRLYAELSASTPRTNGCGCGLWPTAQAMDSIHRSYDSFKGIMERPRQGQKMPPKLADLGHWEQWKAVKMWPTPTSRDHKDTGENTDYQHAADKARLAGVVNVTQGTTGQLNPTWVEWLMGYPEGWTDLGDSATASSRRSRTKS